MRRPPRTALSEGDDGAPGDSGPFLARNEIALMNRSEI